MLQTGVRACKGVGEMLTWLSPLMPYANAHSFNLFKIATTESLRKPEKVHQSGVKKWLRSKLIQ